MTNVDAGMSPPLLEVEFVEELVEERFDDLLDEVDP